MFQSTIIIQRNTYFHFEDNIFLLFQVGNKTHKVNVKELPSFHKGMCYLIESMSNHTSSDWITVTVKKNEDVDIKFVQVTMTSKHDYLGELIAFGVISCLIDSLSTLGIS